LVDVLDLVGGFDLLQYFSCA